MDHFVDIRVGRRRDRAGVQDNEVGLIRLSREAARFERTPERRAVGLRGAAAEIVNGVRTQKNKTYP